MLIAKFSVINTLTMSTSTCGKEELKFLVPPEGKVSLCRVSARHILMRVIMFCIRNYYYYFESTVSSNLSLVLQKRLFRIVNLFIKTELNNDFLATNFLKL